MKEKNTQNHPENVDVAIVGAGISGLYCCYHLWKKKNTPVKIGLFESTNRMGGKIETWRISPEDFEGTLTDDSLKFKEMERLKEMLSHEFPQSASSGNTKSASPKVLSNLLIAEFGPMRIEPQHQPLLEKFLTEIEIKPTEKIDEPKWSDLVSFSPYIGEEPNDPDFHLQGEEAEQSTTIDLLLLAFRRIFEVITIKEPETSVKDASQSDEQKAKDKAAAQSDEPWTIEVNGGIPVNYQELNYFWREMRGSGHLQKIYWKRHMSDWINCLRDEHYQFIRDRFLFKNTLLSDMGFWNVIASVLSHMATVKLRDWGSYYHLLNDNPNAAEWLIFWLRAIRSSNSLAGIRGGMDWIVIKACEKMGIRYWEQGWDGESTVKKEGAEKQITVRCNSTLVKVMEQRDNVELTFKAKNSEEFIVKAEQVILALPKNALHQIVFENSENKSDQINSWRAKFDAILDTVIPIHLVKCFVLVDNPFWEDNRPANRYAYTVPSREVHYWKTPDKQKGLVMMYTDRPGTEFWSNYLLESLKTEDLPGGKKVKKREQETATKFFWKEPKEEEKNYGNLEIEKFDNDRLLRTFFAYVKENHSESVPDNRILAAGIRDWGMKPYSGATHAWRPGSKSKEIIDYLKAFSTLTDNPPNARLHICGESFSDYQGFMEGALRSATEVLMNTFGVSKSELMDTEKERKLCRTRKPFK